MSNSSHTEMGAWKEIYHRIWYYVKGDGIKLKVYVVNPKANTHTHSKTANVVNKPTVEMNWKHF